MEINISNNNNNNNLCNEEQQISVIDNNNNNNNNNSNVLATDLLLSVSIHAEVNKLKISNLAAAASEELHQMATWDQQQLLQEENRDQLEPPLWLFDKVQNLEVLNVAEYRRRFVNSTDETLEEVIRLVTTGGDSLIMNGLPFYDQNPYYNIFDGEFISDKNTSRLNDQDASRATAFVSAEPFRLVLMLMNVDQWQDVFSNIVSKASSLGFLSTGADLRGSPDGTLQVVRAVFHVPSPLVRTWESVFGRYCRQVAYNAWLVTDVSLENIFNDLPLGCESQRRPSGCLIQGLHGGISKITWVENNAVDTSVIQDMLRLNIKPAFAFSANRWIATLVRHYDRKSFMDQQFHQSTNEPKDDDRGNAQQVMNNGRIMPFHQMGLQLDVSGRNNLLKLAERMVRNYTANVTSCAQNMWIPLPITGGENTLLVKTSLNMDDPGVPKGVAITIATSKKLNFPQADIFNFLSNAQNRSKWDMLSRGRVTRDIERFASGRDPSNWVSVVLAEPTAENRAMMYLQETFSDCTGMYVVQAPIDLAAMDHIAAGKNSNLVAILPCGFVILPDSTGGSILTIAFQILDEEASFPDNLPPKSVFTAHHIIKTTVNLIVDELSCTNKY